MQTKKSLAAAIAVALIAVGFAGEARAQSTLVDPVISGVVLPAPSRSGATQLTTITGINFSAGLTLSVVAPDGRKMNYAGQAIQTWRQTSFQAAVLLTSPGAYVFTVTNPDGATSAPFVLKGQPSRVTPSIGRVAPEQPRKDPQPQLLTVNGQGFVQGLSVSITDPIGVVSRITGRAIASLTATSFAISVTFNMTGDYALMVTNPSGDSSNSVTIKVVMGSGPGSLSSVRR